VQCRYLVVLEERHEDCEQVLPLLRRERIRIVEQRNEPINHLLLLLLCSLLSSHLP
jgi:hypothetical protein